MFGCKIWLAAALGCAVLSGVASPEAFAQSIAVGTGVDPSLAQIYVGQEAGIFKKHGLDVSIKLFPSATASTSSLISGDIQFSLTSVPGGAVTHGRSSKVVLLGLADVVQGYDGAAAQSDIATVSDLKHKKVGIALGSASEDVATQTFQRFGMTLKDVDVVNVQPPEMLAALLRQDISAFFVWEPWLTKAKMVAPAQINLLKGSEFFVVETHLVSDRDWIEKNHDTAAKFLAAFKEAGDYCTEHPDEAAGMVGKFLKLDVPLVKQLMAKNHFMLVLDQPAIDYLKDNVDTLIAGNHLAGPFNYADYVYPNLLSELDKSAVHYTLPK